MRPIVFLDIDGVLNGPGEYAKWSAAMRADELDPHAAIVEAQTNGNLDDSHVDLLFSKRCVSVLNQITLIRNSAIVVSSSWRMFYAGRFEELHAILKRVGILTDIIGMTPPNVPHRGYAIQAWLKNNAQDGTHIVILDDEGDYSFPGIERYLLQTDGSTGLVPTDVKKAAKIQSPWVWTP